ncbi:MAG: DUF87 domain-containing protein [Proteobacteria bacterium]|nr:DUF87 domain-containing protein [Pseudomonadota bacterium]
MAQITRIPDYAAEISSYQMVKGSGISLLKNYYLPILTFRNFEVDPLSAITSSLSQVKGDEGLAIQIITKPRPDNWQMSGYEAISKIKKKEFASKENEFIVIRFLKFLLRIIAFILTRILVPSYGTEKDTKTTAKPITALSQSEEVTVAGIENKLTRSGFDSYIRVISFSNNPIEVEQNYRSCIATFSQFSRTNLNSFVEVKEPDSRKLLEDFQSRALDLNSAYVLNTEELASIYHLPSSSVDIPNIDWAPLRQNEIPDNLPTSNCVYIGKASYRNKIIEFGIKEGTDRLRHMYMIGKTGTGKSSLFLNMIIQDILNGNGVGVIDPHGELVRDILDYIPENRIKDVVLVDPSDFERPVGINIMQLEEGESIDRAAAEIVNAFKSIFAESWGPRLEYILRNTVKAIMSVEGTTILGIKRVLEDDDYRKFIVTQLKDPVLKKFFDKEFAEFKSNNKLKTESISPIQNKIGPFETIQIIRNILCQRNSTINFSDIMDSKKIFLFNLSKGMLGDDVKNLFGSLIVSKIQSTVLKRANLSAEQRSPFYLYIDEFQNFTTDTFQSILSESRKYGLGLYLTHQFIEQLSETMRAAVIGNVGTILTYSLGSRDASVMKEVFAPYYDEIDIQNLPNFHVINKMIVDGTSTKPFTAEIIKPWLKYQKTGNKEKIIEHSRNTYGTDRVIVDSRVEKWISTDFKKVLNDLKEKK